MTGEKGSEQAKLNYLIAHDYKNALITTDKQEVEFNRIIKDIENADTEGISMGKELQKAAIEYYTVLKILYTFSRKEIQNEELTRNPIKKEKIKDRTLELAYEKQQLYQNVYISDKKLYTTLKQFERENN